MYGIIDFLRIFTKYLDLEICTILLVNETVENRDQRQDNVEKIGLPTRKQCQLLVFTETDLHLLGISLIHQNTTALRIECSLRLEIMKKLDLLLRRPQRRPVLEVQDSIAVHFL